VTYELNVLLLLVDRLFARSAFEPRETVSRKRQPLDATSVRRSRPDGIVA
jgi:hypothetical protein